jgi:hypothetical protein
MKHRSFTLELRSCGKSTAVSEFRRFLKWRNKRVQRRKEKDAIRQAWICGDFDSLVIDCPHEPNEFILI